jgi:hypothetical protein
MAKKVKTEHAGTKNGGYWGLRVEAKRKSRKLRRREDARAADRGEQVYTIRIR